MKGTRTNNNRRFDSPRTVSGNVHGNHGIISNLGTLSNFETTIEKAIIIIAVIIIISNNN